MGATGQTQQALGGTAIKPPGWDRTGFEAFKYMLYNPETGEILTRTPMSWLKITVFYLIYYSCLAAFWLACLNIFFLTLPEGEPKWKVERSLIGSNPGVGLRPPTSQEMIGSSLYVLSIKDTRKKETNKWDIEGEGENLIDVRTRTGMFLENYKNSTGLQNFNDCQEGQCIFDVTDEKIKEMGCDKDSGYGFRPETAQDGRTLVQPCFFLKLNKIVGFKPLAWTDADTKELKDAKDKERIKSVNVSMANNADNVYITCEGRYPADKEAVDLEFWPKDQSIKTKYFPYFKNKDVNYQSPFVIVKVKPSRSYAMNQLVHIECRAWYAYVNSEGERKRVKHSTKDKEGLMQFEVQIVDFIPKGVLKPEDQ